MRALVLAAWLVPALAPAQPAPILDPSLPGVSTVATGVPANDDGTHLDVSFTPSPSGEVTHHELFRTVAFPGVAGFAKSPTTDGDLWVLVARLPAGDRARRVTHHDQVPDGALAYRYAVRAIARPPTAGGPDEDTAPLPPGTRVTPFSVTGADRPVGAWFDRTRWFLLALIVLATALIGYYIGRARRDGKKMYIRRVPGIDAMEEAIGRSTEMGRPVLYIPGIEEIQDIQTIAGLLTLGHVAEMCARYDTEIRVPCVYPMNMIVAEEIVRQGFYNAGRPDAHKPQNIQFISSEQFAFCAGVNGIILREKPATNIYLGRFYAESLILAETGYVNKSIQIAGTAEITQLPFFIAACDYTLIGEEIYAVSAYLTREPRLLSTLKTTDALKVLVLALIVVGAAGTTFEWFDLAGWLLP